MKSIIILFLLTIAAQYTTASELITFDNGKLGVNFGGYHAAVGLGGFLGGDARGGLYAEAGTPFGQNAVAGLGGAVNGDGKSAGALYAGATAGGNVKASAGLGGGTSAHRASGVGVASAQAGGNYASHILAGDSSIENGYQPVTVLTEDTEEKLTVKPLHKKVHAEFNFDAANEVKSVPVTEVITDINVQPKTYVKEVTYVKTPVVKEKHVHRAHKPSRHHLRKTAYVGGYVGSDLGVESPEQTVFINQPAIDRRIGVEVDSSAQANVNTQVPSSGGQIVYRKQTAIERNPMFFSDIFNIPISALKAVGDLFGNTAKSTSVSFQKSASVSADADSITPHRQQSSSVSSSSDGHVSIQTPSASKVVDDILAIPINTLGAVRQFLENNVPARKRVEVSHVGQASVNLEH